jgi:transcriptional regulator with XRE-family HTH domain
MKHAPYSEFVTAFIARTKQLREESKRTQEQVATALGIPLESYRKYETRSAIRIHLIDRFIAIVDGDLQYLMSGRRTKRAKTKKPPLPPQA